MCVCVQLLMTSSSAAGTLKAIHTVTEEEIMAMSGEDYYDPVTK